MDRPRVVSTRVVYENRWMRLHEDRTESTDGREGLKSLELLIAMYRSARDGTRINLPLEY